MKIDPRIQIRFNELEKAINQVEIKKTSVGLIIDNQDWQKWSSSVTNLLTIAFGDTAVHTLNFKKIYDAFKGYPSKFESACGVFRSAKEDYEQGYIVSLEKMISGEILGDFVTLAKTALAEGHKDVAAVLACAALEDTLKKYARTQGLDVDDEVMQRVVGALKSKGIVNGAQKSLLDSMPKIRDYAMHANWDKIKPEDVSSVIGFVEQFLLSNF
jgi:hypothetical protein